MGLSWAGGRLAALRSGARTPTALVVYEGEALEARRTGGVHLAPQVGTNLALMNALTRELFAQGWVDDEWVADHTLGVAVSVAAVALGAGLSATFIRQRSINSPRFSVRNSYIIRLMG